jgi:branched-chain amino acid transport system permease protein
MSTVVLLTLTGLGLGALYFLIASGLSLIFGLADVLNFAHGLLLSVGAYAAWWVGARAPFAVAVVVGVLTGTVLAVAVELALIRPLYGRPLQQVLVTVGLAAAGAALLQAVWGADPVPFNRPAWTGGTTRLLGAAVPNDRFLLVGAAVAVLAALLLFLGRTRTGLVVRAGVEDRAMVTALGIDVRRAFTLVFAIGGAAAALAGTLAGMYFGSVTPGLGASLLIFAFIVVVIGGTGSVVGCALAAVLVGVVQQFANFYAAPGVGEASVVLLLAAVLLVRPGGLARRPA